MTRTPGRGLGRNREPSILSGSRGPQSILMFSPFFSTIILARFPMLRTGPRKNYCWRAQECEASSPLRAFARLDVQRSKQTFRIEELEVGIRALKILPIRNSACPPLLNGGCEACTPPFPKPKKSKPGTSKAFSRTPIEDCLVRKCFLDVLSPLVLRRKAL